MGAKKNRFRVVLLEPQGNEQFYRVIFETPLTLWEKETHLDIKTFAYIPGVKSLMVSENDIVVVGANEFSDYDMLESIIEYLKGIGHKNIGGDTRQILATKENIESDPMFNSVRKAGEIARDVFGNLLNSTPEEVEDILSDRRRYKKKSVLVLKKELREAVKEENYEKAAKLRDLILEREEEES